MGGARKEKAPRASGEARGAAEALGRAIDVANVARPRLPRGQKLETSFEKTLALTTLLGPTFWSQKKVNLASLLKRALRSEKWGLR